MSESTVKRYVTLRFGDGWIVWDNQKARIVDGVYYGESGRDTAIDVTALANKDINWLDREWMDHPTDFKDAA